MALIYLNSIRNDLSVNDGPGYRLVIFLQGCDIHCKGCQNKSIQNMNDVEPIEVSQLVNQIRNKLKETGNVINRITVSGGEPLLQKDALLELLIELQDLDICLYTGHELNEVPEIFFQYLNFVKTGPFILNLFTRTKPFVGSTNQTMWEIDKETLEPHEYEAQ
ncbi:4Fe-4S single cluster domain-containing protein [Ureaplasma ceti]|uniref:Anaerobic ribonucleoside-triphosphate reductase-activating protein n=1 Tax=Ureaplasma ceti TaxID=3119530 RepID=A0ABP9UA23_9BACT